MYCPQCGKEISDQAKFCRFCGSRLDGLYEPQPARQKKHRSAKIAGIVICIAAILIVIPLTLFAVFRFRTGISGKRADAARFFCGRRDSWTISGCVGVSGGFRRCIGSFPPVCGGDRRRRGSGGP